MTTGHDRCSHDCTILHTSSIYASLLAALFVACASPGSAAPHAQPAASVPTPGDGGPAGEGDETAHDGGSPGPLDLRLDGAFARSAHPLRDGGFLVLYEHPVHLKERWGRPLRWVTWIDGTGHVRAQREATTGRELLDAAAHPSGDVTLLEASNEGYFVLRLDPNGMVRVETRLVDDVIWAEPPAMLPIESRSRIEETTHDTGRLAADGEQVFVATRTGRHSVIAYRMRAEAKELVTTARTLVVPAHSIAPTGLNGGSYDTFDQLGAHYGVFVAIGADGVGWVGTGHARLETGAFVRAHANVFGEKLVTDPDYLDVYVSRISPDGTRLGTTVVSTENDEQLYGIRAVVDGVVALGRSEKWNELGTGFDVLVARIDHAGVPTVRTFDVDRGDIAFDVAEADDGDLLVAGASGYAQNPSGASVTEESHTFVRRLHADGTTAPIAGIPDGPRHSEVRFVLARSGALVVGGMVDGPGTHSADGDPRRLDARAFIKEVPAD